ncbi:alpha/beta fold hydrolase [Psychroserpens sp. XS_ASV72]|uniref:alpha/beta fold hydrolase n=1 Tax=Psychroserpens sp. XS_ASV72 TaxID=3241293 RepID=UPI003512FBC5
MKFKLLAIVALCFSFSHAQDNFISEEILVMNDSIQLPGTLTYNAELKQQPLLIFVSGSGNPDRNGNQPQFGVNGNYIKQFSEAMNKKGIAFFRYDKRNVTASNIKFIMESYEFQDLVNDVSAVIDQFKDDKRFNSITLIGHSQGSLVSMMATNEHVDKYISLAGIGESVDKTIIRQYNAQSPELAKVVAAHIDELKSSGTIEDINPMLMGLFAKQNHQFLKSYLKLDPTEEIKNLEIPILVINGTKDVQVEVKDAENLHNANPDSELVIIDKMNHVLKVIEKDEDNLASYMSPDFPLSEALVTTVEKFIKK